MEMTVIGLDKQKIERKIVNIFLSLSFNILSLGAQKNHLYETVLLSKPQHMFWLRNVFLIMHPRLYLNVKSKQANQAIKFINP